MTHLLVKVLLSLSREMGNAFKFQIPCNGFRLNKPYVYNPGNEARYGCIKRYTPSSLLKMMKSLRLFGKRSIKFFFS